MIYKDSLVSWEERLIFFFCYLKRVIVTKAVWTLCYYFCFFFCGKFLKGKKNSPRSKHTHTQSLDTSTNWQLRSMERLRGKRDKGNLNMLLALAVLYPPWFVGKGCGLGLDGSFHAFLTLLTVVIIILSTNMLIPSSQWSWDVCILRSLETRSGIRVSGTREPSLIYLSAGHQSCIASSLVIDSFVSLWFHPRNTKLFLQSLIPKQRSLSEE